MMQKVQSYFQNIIVGAMILFLLACATAPYTGRSQVMLVDWRQELALGHQASQEIKKKARLSRNPRYVQRVQTVGRRIARVANMPQFRWEFNVIESPKKNAFALPGGKVYFYTGMLDFIKTDEELATVMAHEIAHAIARHGAERMSTAMLAEMGGAVASQALNLKTPGAQRAFAQAYGLAANVGVILPYSRTQESEADRIGLILMAKAGYDPRAAIGFWQRMSRSSRGSSVPVFLSTHPTDAQRIANIQAHLPEAMRYYTGVRP
jgi:predicted Zn-dependent protease